MADKIMIHPLVLAACDGDEDAFRELLEEHRDAITATLIACGVRQRETAQDLARETALRAQAGLASLRIPGTFSARVRQIATNAARDHLRRATVHKEKSLDSAWARAGDTGHGYWGGRNQQPRSGAHPDHQY